jgi:hypothetical protein
MQKYNFFGNLKGDGSFFSKMVFEDQNKKNTISKHS